MYKISHQFIFKRKILISVVITFCIIFLVYQILSLTQLNSVESKDFQDKIVIKVTSQVPHHHGDDENLGPKQELTYEPVAGVLPKYYSLYQAKDNFNCILSREKIPFSYVNDDYCDCNDGSDEPSTSACPNNRFYCNSGDKITSVSSSKVNDGICDCCDGSDEYLNLGPPLILSSSQINVIKSSGIKVHHPPCPNVC